MTARKRPTRLTIALTSVLVAVLAFVAIALGVRFSGPQTEDDCYAAHPFPTSSENLQAVADTSDAINECIKGLDS